MASAHTITIADDGQTFRCTEQRSLLEGMEQLGKKSIPVGCRNGGCGVCKVQVLSGSYTARVMSRAHVSVEDEQCGRVLACRVKPTSDIRLEVIGKMKKNVCGATAAAGAGGFYST